MLLEKAYTLHRRRAPERQKEALPETYSEYVEYKEKYGTYPGEIVGRDGHKCLVCSVEGEPDMTAAVTYYDFVDEQEYTTGIANFQRKINRKF